jgi:hypothetical protein
VIDYKHGRHRKKPMKLKAKLKAKWLLPLALFPFIPGYLQPDYPQYEPQNQYLLTPRSHLYVRSPKILTRKAALARKGKLHSLPEAAR